MSCTFAQGSTDSTSTFEHCDTNNTKSVDLDDILEVLDGFSGAMPPEEVPSVDLLGCRTDGAIDLDDILEVLDAFGGDTYSCPTPCP